ncbi:MAG: preprotein translocase subunit SecY [Candidatus Moranbacteria bacterium]|nr:preprotein translocase subunit SecY [Candidatus Moranbacteria bacterium]
MISVLSRIFSVPELRNKIFFILALLVVFRLAANIPLPGVDVERLRFLFESNQFLGLLNIFSGGGLQNISIVLLGLGPYITSSIIMQLLTMIVPRLEQLYKEEGEAGRQKFTMITRWITVPLAVAQTFSMISLLRSQQVLVGLSTFDTVAIVVTATAGTIFLMWLGELITEKGLGNGVSIMIFAGIVASLPSVTSQFLATFDSTEIFTYLLFFAVALVTLVGIVFVTEGQRIIPISYAKRMRGGVAYGGSMTHLPLRVNQAGVIPIIFAISIILFPGMVAGFLSQVASPSIAGVAEAVNRLFQNQIFYGFLYFFLVVVFTYFYTAVIFDPEKISKNLQKQGGYVPGVRPGRATAEYLQYIVHRITLAGALFLGSVAVLPIVVQGFTGIGAISIGGTSVLIAVSVVIEIVKNVESQLLMRDYDVV